MANNEHIRSPEPGARTSVPAVMTVAGSDSGGGAGIQADLKTFSALDVFGTSAVTCVTAQNPDEVRGVAVLDPDIVDLQIRTVCGAFPVRAAKTGMLYSAEIVSAVARALKDCGVPSLVVDPVMIATSGARLLRPDAVRALCAELLCAATVITPNIPEAELLLGQRIESAGRMPEAACELARRFGTACALKGGHLEGGDRDLVVDVLWSDGQCRRFTSPRVPVVETHGTGCTFSAALAAFLGRGEALADAVESAQRYVGRALGAAVRVGEHSPMGWRQAAR